MTGVFSVVVDVCERERIVRKGEGNVGGVAEVCKWAVVACNYTSCCYDFADSFYVKNQM